MSIIDSLITNRTQADVAALHALLAKAKAGTLTDEEWAVLADPAHKGAYNYTDLNRVSAALDYLAVLLRGYGYAVPGYQRIKVPHKTTSNRRLPEGHTELKWIESTGTQYVDSLFKPNQDTKVVVDVQFSEVPTTHSALFGARNANTNQFWAYYRYTENAYSGRFGTTADRTIAFDPTERAMVALDSNVLTVNGVSVSANEATFASEQSLYLFAVNNAEVEYRQYPGAFKLFASEIYGDGELVRDYVPDLTDDGQVGLYDLVEGKFYPNAGSGVFTAGDVIEWAGSTDSNDAEKNPYAWYIDDIPSASLMSLYLANVAAIRDALAMLSTTPAVPKDMELLTSAEANAIELILLDVYTLINNMAAAWFYNGELYSGEV